MKFFKGFAKNKQKKEKLEKQIQAIVDPIEPLVLPSITNYGGRPKVLTDAQVIQIMRWKNENISNSEIARRLHVSEGTIRNYIKSYTTDNYAPV